MQTFRSASLNVLAATSTHQRTTAPDAGDRFRSALRESTNTLLQGATQLGLPTTPLLTAALSSSGSSSNALEDGDALTDSSSDSADPLMASATGSSQSQQMQFINLQQRISDENRRYSTLSNVLKARHETAKNAIGNIR